MKQLFFFAVLVLCAALPSQAKFESLDAGHISCPAPTAAAPVWGKLVITGNSVSCYYGTGIGMPSSWTQIGKAQTIGFMNNPLLVGMYVCAHNSTTLCSGTIDNFSILPAAAYRLADCDIGAQTFMGSANLINGVWNLSGGGSDIWRSTDQFNFQPWLVWGNCTVICRITSLGAGDGWQKIGLMVRDSYNSGSGYALFCATGAAGVDFQWRPGSNDNPDTTQLVAPPTPGVPSSLSIGYSSTGPAAYVLRP